jgi:beta-mannosidase
MALVRGASLVEIMPLDGWSVAESAAARPEELPPDVVWLPLPEPMPVAAALRSHGKWSLDEPRPLDAETWWYRCRIPPLGVDPASRAVLRIGGIATLADVFVDGQHVLRSENMFHEHRIDLSALTHKAVHRMSGTFRSGAGQGEGGSWPPGAELHPHELAIRIAPLNEALAAKRPRPRWKTKLVSHQQLRWIRSSLAGRMPGWTPPAPPVGPWRPVTVERWRRVVVGDADVRTAVVGGDGIVKVTLRASNLTSEALHDPVLRVGEATASLDARQDPTTGELFLFGTVTIPAVGLWWPHTHGDRAWYPARVTFDVGDVRAEVDLGLLSFRTVELDTEGGDGFSLRVNGVRVFCRGASWTTVDIATLSGKSSDYQRVLGAMRDAGMNMVRVSGTMFYESDAFYDTCDELGILVWQDFMFANMDYPVLDESFRASVEREAAEILGRLQARPSLAVLCGGSEVEQQAAMFGAAREIWSGPLFEQVLRDACVAQCPGVPYWPNTPSGGALPFHVDRGVSHYYGVGAYLRPLEDARRANVRFTTECLAFANVPEEDLFPSFLREGEVPVVHARWKARTCKDSGAGWDFEDVRDHYVALLFGVDPMRLRYQDMDRYLALGRVATGEVMARVFAEFRRSGSSCRGGLVWFLQDLWPGAGWGILDSRGLPKSPYWFLKRALQPLSVFLTDEGVNGLHVHAVNDGPAEVAGRLSLSLYRDGEILTTSGATDLVIPARDAIAVAGDGLLERFADSSRAYRFGPPGHDVAVASLVAPSGDVLAEAVRTLDLGAPPPCVGLEASLDRSPAGTLAVTIRTKRYAQAVTVTVPGHVADDNYFDLAPGRTRIVPLRAIEPGPTRLFGARVSALNLATPIDLEG